MRLRPSFAYVDNMSLIPKMISSSGTLVDCRGSDPTRDARVFERPQRWKVYLSRRPVAGGDTQIIYRLSLWWKGREDCEEPKDKNRTVDQGRACRLSGERKLCDHSSHGRSRSHPPWFSASSSLGKLVYALMSTGTEIQQLLPWCLFRMFWWK